MFGEFDWMYLSVVIPAFNEGGKIAADPLGIRELLGAHDLDLGLAPGIPLLAGVGLGDRFVKGGPIVLAKLRGDAPHEVRSLEFVVDRFR